MNFDNRIYYDDQSDWQPSNFYGLWRYFDRLFQYIGPTKKLRDALSDPSILSERDRIRVASAAAYQEKRTGKKDEELVALDLARMSEDTRYLMKHMLVDAGRYELALERFPNLAGLEDVGALGHELRLDVSPRDDNPYYKQKGIRL